MAKWIIDQNTLCLFRAFFVVAFLADDEIVVVYLLLLLTSQPDLVGHHELVVDLDELVIIYYHTKKFNIV